MTSELSGTRKKDTASLEEGKEEPREEMEVKRGQGQSKMLEKRIKVHPILLTA